MHVLSPRTGKKLQMVQKHPSPPIGDEGFGGYHNQQWNNVAEQTSALLPQNSSNFVRATQQHVGMLHQSPNALRNFLVWQFCD